MPDFIDLLSSPIRSPKGKHQSSTRVSAQRHPSSKLVPINSDDFNFSLLSDDLEFPTQRSAKRLRITPHKARAKPSCPSGSEGRPVILLSDCDDLTTLGEARDATAASAAVDYEWEGLVSDPIVFTSSAPEPGSTRRHGARPEIPDFLQDNAPAARRSSSLARPYSSASSRTYLSTRTADLLANISKVPPKLSGKHETYVKASIDPTAAVSLLSKSMAITSSSSVADDIVGSSPPMKRLQQPTKSSGPKLAETGARAADRNAAKAEKELEKARKLAAKEQKAKEKEVAADRAQINKSRLDKKLSTPEMIVDIASGLKGRSVGTQVVEFMGLLGVETTFFEDQLDATEGLGNILSTGNVVKWRRKIGAEYNEELGLWERLSSPKIVREKHVLVLLSAAEFAHVAAKSGDGGNQVTKDEGVMTNNLDKHVCDLRTKYNGCTPIYLVEGLSAWLRKSKSAKNREYTAAVHSRLLADGGFAPQASSQPVRKRKAPAATELSAIDDDVAESLLLHLQLNQNVYIQHTKSSAASAEWIKTFTEHISTIPYRQERMLMNDNNASFCMDVGQVRTGDDVLDTYVKVLQEVRRVTPAMAYGIVNHYATVHQLVAGFKQHGPLMLENVRKSANKDGAMTDCRLGPAVSKRLYKVFMGLDAWSTDGIA